MLKREHNQRLTERFDRLFPGGHTNFRVPIDATGWVDVPYRVFIARAEGCHVWDVDGNEYIDYTGAMGPNLLGHCHPEYTGALREFLGRMGVCMGSGLLQTPYDIELAEKLVEHVPCAEQVKFCVTGSEAVQMAIRLARAYTGKNHFIRFGGHYHGWFDNVLGGTISQNTAGKPFAHYDPDADPFTDACFTLGRGAGTAEESFLLPWNDIGRLENVLETYGKEVALIHFEAIVCNHFCLMPRPGFLERIRELCDAYNVVMSMDEVITGFRLGLSGAQGYFGITPDLATLAKTIAGGLPFSAVVGKAEIMELLRDRRVLGPGTFNGYPLGVRAALETVRILERGNGAAYRQIDRVQQRLTDGLRAIARDKGIPMRIQGARGVFFTLFGLDDAATAYTDEDLEDLDIQAIFDFWVGMKQEGIGILAGCRWYLTLAHTDEDVDKTLEAAERVMSRL